jgi:DNA recombination protein RmuC
MDAMIIINCTIGILIFIIFIKIVFFNNNPEQLLDLKNQLHELKTRQLEAQNQSLLEQQRLFAQTQKVLNEQLQMVNNSLNAGQTSINSQLSHANQVINEVFGKVGMLEATALNIQAIGKDIASLQDILQAPKLRGNLGEYLLEDLLRQIFPADNFEIKYNFGNGTQVDAIIKIGNHIVPIDAKFPLESFQRLAVAENDEDKKRAKKEFITSVKRRIDEIADKYINPAEGTFDFAMMYVPAENIFYETIINDSITEKEYEIFNYAVSRHVIPVSPNSFYAYLMAIVYGLKGFKIEQQAWQIVNQLTALQNNFSDFYKEFTIIGRHLDNASGKFRDCQKKAERFHDKVSEITGLKVDLTESDRVPLENENRNSKALEQS